MEEIENDVVSIEYGISLFIAYFSKNEKLLSFELFATIFKLSITCLSYCIFM